MYDRAKIWVEGGAGGNGCVSFRREIIVRQRGTRFWPGDGTGLGRDHTIFATRAGTVAFKPSRMGRTISVLQD